jgi:hypothetical protein
MKGIFRHTFSKCVLYDFAQIAYCSSLSIIASTNLRLHTDGICSSAIAEVEVRWFVSNRFNYVADDNVTR